MTWIAFGTQPREEAERLGLLPGDGIARRIKVFDRDTRDIQERMQQMELLSMEYGCFNARDVNSMQHCCRWEDAVAYEKRYDD